MTIYSLLNADAKVWWYHKQLRAQGNYTEARKRERASILSAVETLRTAICFKVSRGGHTVYRDGGGTLQGYQDMGGRDVQCALMLNIPVINTLTIPDSVAQRMSAFPLLAQRIQDENTVPYGSMDCAPLQRWAAMYQHLGAEIHNLSVPEYDPEWLTVKPAQNKAIGAFMNGDEASLFEAMCEMKE